MSTATLTRPATVASVEAETLTVVLPPEGSGKTTCDSCLHPRRSHSIQGCLHNGGCPYGCVVKWAEL